MADKIDEAEEITAAHEIAFQVIITTICQHDKALGTKIANGLEEAASTQGESPTKRFLRDLAEHISQGC